MNFLFSHRVLRDCETALELLRKEYDQDRWRVHWVGAIALIRAVGHVLRSVDLKEIPELRCKIDTAFHSWKTGEEHRIFREFIDQERNNVLKEYRSSISDLPGARMSKIGRPGQNPIMRLSNQDGSYTDYFEVDEFPFRPKLRGYRAGENAVDIYLSAIEWWRTQLREIAA